MAVKNYQFGKHLKMSAKTRRLNEDWMRTLRWDLPPYKSKEFMRLLETTGMTLRQFKRLPVYQAAKEKGLVDSNDEWVGPIV